MNQQASSPRNAHVICVILALGVLSTAAGVSGCGEGTPNPDADAVADRVIEKLSPELDELRKQIGSLTTNPDADAVADRIIEKLSSELDELRKQIGSLTTNGGGAAALSNSEIVGRLNDLEADTEKADSWPKLPQDAEEFRRKFRDIVSASSEQQHEAFASKFLRVGWSASAFKVLTEKNASDGRDAHEIYLESLDSLMNAIPDGLPKEFVSRMNAELREAEHAIAAILRGDAIAAAKKALDSDDHEQATVAWQRLNGVAVKDNAEVQMLADSLRNKVLAAEVEAQCEHWMKRLDRIAKIEQGVLRHVARSQLYDQVIALRLERTLSETPLTGKSLSEIKKFQTRVEMEIKDAARVQADSEAKHRREYQRWTLKQIKQYESRQYDRASDLIAKMFDKFETSSKQIQCPLLEEFPAVRNSLAKKSGCRIVADKNGRVVISKEDQRKIFRVEDTTVGKYVHQDELAYLVDREAVIRFLLPVETSLLELPVQNLYSKAFQKAWSNAEGGGRGHQLAIAKATVTVKKVLEARK